MRIRVINEKIYDYVMSKIYCKIFPTESDNKDNKIFENTIKLSWVEPMHFIPGKKNYIYDSFLPDVIEDFYLLNKEKSPRKKIISMSNIFATIRNLVKFNNEGTDYIGVDDQMPILNYSLIKAQPQRIYSTIFQSLTNSQKNRIINTFLRDEQNTFFEKFDKIFNSINLVK